MQQRRIGATIRTAKKRVSVELQGRRYVISFYIAGPKVGPPSLHAGVEPQEDEAVAPLWTGGAWGRADSALSAEKTSVTPWDP